MPVRPIRSSLRPAGPGLVNLASRHRTRNAPLTRRMMMGAPLLAFLRPQPLDAGDLAVLPLSTLLKPAPRAATFDVVLTDATGRQAPLSSWRGKPVLLHLWATWCGPCLRELPALDAFYPTHRNGVTILPVAVASGPADRIAAFYRTHDVTHLPVYTADAAAIQAAYGETELVLPATLRLDSAGRLVGEASGSLDWGAPDAAATLARIAGGK
jgi:thiol-disulfide isomerase/thioredoxin